MQDRGTTRPACINSCWSALKAGDIGTVVHTHKGGAGYEVEFMTLAAETVAVETLRPEQLRSNAPRDIARVCELVPNRVTLQAAGPAASPRCADPACRRLR
jgi:hypothetical protein